MADVGLLFEICREEGKTVFHFVTLPFFHYWSLGSSRESSGGKKTQQESSCLLVSPSNAKDWGEVGREGGVRPEVMGTFFHWETFRVTRPEMLRNRSKHTQPLFHKSISSTKAANQERRGSGGGGSYRGLMFLLERS